MKKLLLFILTFILTSINTYSQSLIPNPSLEEWWTHPRTGYWCPLLWWSFRNDSLIIQSNDAVDGIYSARWDLMSNGTNWIYTELYLDLPPYFIMYYDPPAYVEPFYYISYWVKYEGFENAIRFITELFVQGIRLTDINFCSGTWDIISGQNQKDVQPGIWQQVSFPLDYFNTGDHNCYPLDSLIVADPGNITILVGAAGQDTVAIGPGSIYIDHIQLSETPLFTTFLKPKRREVFISGQQDTIKWEPGSAGRMVKLKYSTNGGQNYYIIKDSLQYNDGEYIWDVPKELLTKKAKIILSDQTTNEALVESEYFTIKPYIITKKDYNGDLIAYNINTDRWGFGNTPDEMWPDTFYNQFNYQAGIDPFTNNAYDQGAGGGVFAGAVSSERPDWVSFVGAFGQNACYTASGEYSLPALNKWAAVKDNWLGSCFGIAISNALAFEKYYQFTSRYPFFPYFAEPITVHSNSSVIPVIMELFTHQYGNLHQEYRNSIGIHKTPTETIEDIKQMLKQENVEIRTLSFNNNGPDGGGHAINVYKLEQDTINTNLYYVYVWDNSYPNVLDARIVVNVDHNGGIGFWDPEYGWDGWEGETKFYLRDPASNYLTNAVLAKGQITHSPLILDENELEIYNSSDADIIIEDNFGNQTGFTSSGLKEDIPNSIPLIVEDGSTGPPYGYYLPKDNYSVELSNFTNDKVNTFIFTGNKSFSYERSGATSTQTDKLFFDGGVSVTNPDGETKSVKLINIISDTTSADEKLFLFRSLNLAQNDSVKIINPDDNKLDLISYGSQKNYQVELEYVSDVVSSRFLNDNVTLSANTTHKLVPNWGDFADLMLTIYVDEGNNGTIDDTLEIINQVTGVGEDQGSLIPTEYRLEQNYPNPFNNSTVIKYSIPKEGLVTLKIYNAIGEEVVTLINETKQSGNYKVTFSTEELTSGVYFYQLKTGTYIETKKMILLK